MAMLNSPIVPDDTKEACAIGTMQMMLLDYAEETGISFEQAISEFANSTTYQVLFDYETGVWREGPDYLRCLFDQARETQ